MSKGRSVPADYRARIDRAQAISDQFADILPQLVATFPPRVRLPDGRKLVLVNRTPANVGYRCADGMAVMASYDPTPHGLLKHVSLSYATKDPSWHDIKQVRATFFDGDTDVIQVLPREDEYVNVHAHCFHLFEAPETWQGGWFV